MKKHLTIVTLLFAFTLNAQSIFGKWNSTNDETGEVDSVIEIYKKNNKAFAKVVKIIDSSRQNSVCTACEGENKNKRILGLDILTGLEKNDYEWSGGEILDPRNGSVYNCYIKLVKKDKLKIRGFIGVAIFGKTKYWERAK
ncbi:DUF2147 domain-containing protein [Polaribacter sp.]|uniref:DUF2147 domain-containing protein n=1 Tax=Polaribacter sp. TaxID=1920175 RepID=UPI0025F5B940|nr:DUF2147 domain-containing protein [Polaribacter sp.]